MRGLEFFEDNEAVIKVISEGRSPTVRHVSRTHGVALDFLFDRINFGPNKSESNMSTPETNWQTYCPKSTFTRDDWHHLLRLFNFTSNSVFFLQPLQQTT